MLECLPISESPRTQMLLKKCRHWRIFAIPARYFIHLKVAVLIIDIISIFMTMIMIYNVKRKYIAVGRKEIVIFFYFYMLSLIVDMLLGTNIIGTTSFVYPVRKYARYLLVSCCPLCGVGLRMFLVASVEWACCISMG